MPMLTTSVIFLPVAPFASPERTASENFAIASSTACTSGTTSCPSTSTFAPFGWRSAVCSTARFSVMLIFSPAEHGVAPLFDARGLGRRGQKLHRRLGHRAFRPVEQQVAVDKRELFEALRIAGESRAHVFRHIREMILERNEGWPGTSCLPL